MANRSIKMGRMVRTQPDLARRRLLEALSKTGGNVGWAADQMGIGLTTIRRWMKRLDDDGRVSAALEEMRGRTDWKKRRRRPRGYAEVG